MPFKLGHLVYLLPFFFFSVHGTTYKLNYKKCCYCSSPRLKYLGIFQVYRYTERVKVNQAEVSRSGLFLSAGSPEFKAGVHSLDESYSLELHDGAVTVPTS